MTVEHTGEQRGSLTFSLRIREEKEKADEQIRLARETGHFQGFIDSQLSLLDQDTPGSGKVIKEAIGRQKSRKLSEDMFVTLWRYAVVSRALLKEFGQPEQPNQ